jgi:hypothetical protein
MAGSEFEAPVDDDERELLSDPDPLASELPLVLLKVPLLVPTTHCESVFWSVKSPLDPKGVMVRL